MRSFAIESTSCPHTMLEGCLGVVLLRSCLNRRLTAEDSSSQKPTKAQVHDKFHDAIRPANLRVVLLFETPSTRVYGSLILSDPCSSYLLARLWLSAWQVLIVGHPARAKRLHPSQWQKQQEGNTGVQSGNTRTAHPHTTQKCNRAHRGCTTLITVPPIAGCAWQQHKQQIQQEQQQRTIVSCRFQVTSKNKYSSSNRTNGFSHQWTKTTNLAAS